MQLVNEYHSDIKEYWVIVKSSQYFLLLLILYFLLCGRYKIENFRIFRFDIC
jgi:hypothetical protein